MIKIEKKSEQPVNCMNCRYCQYNLLAYKLDPEKDCGLKNIDVDNPYLTSCDQFERIKCGDECILFSLMQKNACRRDNKQKVIGSECIFPQVPEKPLEPSILYNCGSCGNLIHYPPPDGRDYICRIHGLVLEMGRYAEIIVCENFRRAWITREQWI